MTETTTAPPEPQASKGATTEYIILEHGVANAGDIPPEPVWREVTRVQAGNPGAAMRAHAEKSSSSKPLKLAAVAARYWTTETLKPTTVTTWETAP